MLSHVVIDLVEIIIKKISRPITNSKKVVLSKEFKVVSSLCFKTNSWLCLKRKVVTFYDCLC